MEPMLACQESPDLAGLQYPILASPKLDGVRAVVRAGRLLSRKLLPIPNRFVARRFSSSAYSGLDGELVLGDPTAKDCFRKTSQALRTIEGEPDVKFWVFDNWKIKRPFECRLAHTEARVESLQHLCGVPHLVCNKPDDVRLYEKITLEKGYEGLILRAPDGPYKYGRSTLKEGWMLKVKRFVDGEATIVGFLEEMQNTNPATRDKLGRTKRSKRKEGMVGKGILGAFVCESPEFPGYRFEVGGGLNDRDSKLYWDNREKLLGKTIKYKHFPKGGKDRPRHAVFLGLRDSWDQ